MKSGIYRIDVFAETGGLTADGVAVMMGNDGFSYVKLHHLKIKATQKETVEVVRCKDCKHWHEGTGWCNQHSHFVDRVGDFCYSEESGDWKMFDADYFCKDGEGKPIGQARKIIQMQILMIVVK